MSFNAHLPMSNSTVSPEQASVFPKNKRLRLGVWGLGRGLHIVTVANALNIDVVAGCDFNPHFLEIFHKQIPSGRFTNDADEFLSWDFDAVLIATYCPAHAEHSIKALKSGKHVLSEVTAFHTLAEGVALVEAVEQSGKIYQLAENYPFQPNNRYLANLWQSGWFGQLQYAEYSYVHDCLNFTYTYIDGTPIKPGYSVHNWRSWLPWHYYCTHSLGPVLYITGERPTEVVSLPGTVQLPGQILPSGSGLSGVAPSLIRFGNGGLMRNLMGNTTLDNDVQRLYGTRASAEIKDGKLLLRPCGRGHSWALEASPQDDALSRIAASTGHGGGDFWTLYHFANEIFTGAPGPFNCYRAADVTLPGILAYRSSQEGGKPQEIPNFRNQTIRDKYRHDSFAPARADTNSIAFSSPAAQQKAAPFTDVMSRLLEAADFWQHFAHSRPIYDSLKEPEAVIQLADRMLERLSFIRQAILDAQSLLGIEPSGNGERALRETLARFDLDSLLSPNALSQLISERDSLAERLPHTPLADGEEPPRWPQLHMLRVGFDNLPEIKLPNGFKLRASRGEADCENWCKIIGASFADERTAENYQKAILNYAGYAPERHFFIEDSDGVACATAGAFGAYDRGYVHYVGVLPSHLGHKLGYWVSLAVLHCFKERGLKFCMLTTDDFRIPAVKTYLRLGFRPLITHRSHKARWQRLASLNS